MINKGRVLQLKNNLCTEIEKEFKFIGGKLEFKRPFSIYVSEGNSFDDSYMKSKYLVIGMIDGKSLICSTDDSISLFKTEKHLLEELRVRDLEDIVEVAHVLDELQSNNVKLVENY